MTERLTPLMKISEGQYASGSPLLLEACALYQDTAFGQCIAQLKWKNLDPRPVKAVMIELDGYDVFNQKLEPVNFQYDGLMATQGSEFGSKVPVQILNSNVVRYDTILKAVSFAEGDVWQADHTVSFAVLPKSKEQELKGELLEQFKRDLSKQGIISAAQFQPQTSMGLWQCGCGSWQLEGTPCLKCGTTITNLRESASESLLREHLNAHNQEQERLRVEAEAQAEKDRIAREREEAERKVREEQEKQRREKLMAIANAEAAKAKKKKNMIAAVAAIAAVAVIAFIIVNFTVLEPQRHMKNGEDAFAAGNYYDAYQEYTSAGERGAERAAVSIELFGDQMMEQFNYSRAISAYDIAGSIQKKNIASVFAAATNEESQLSASDCKDNQLPEAIYTYKVEQGKNEYYGLLSVGDNKWGIDAKYIEVYYIGSILYAYGENTIDIIDIQSGRVTTLQSAKRIEYPSPEGFWYLTEDKKYGYADSSGETLLPAEYTSVINTEDGVFAVEKDSLWGFVNPKGEIILDFQYDNVGNINDGYAEIYSKARKVKQGNVYVTTPEGWGVIDMEGHILIETQWTEIDISDGFAQNRIAKVYDGDKYGIVSFENNTILSCRYSDIGVFNEGVVYVEIKAPKSYYTKNSFAGFVDADGNMVLDLIKIGIDGSYGTQNMFINGCAVIQAWVNSTSIRECVIDKEGHFLTDWGDCYRHEDGDVTVDDVDYYTKDGKLYKWSDSSSETPKSAFMKQWGMVYDFSQEGIARVALNSHTERASYSDYDMVIADPPYGFVTDKETVLVDPCYDNARDFCNGYAAVSLEGKWGLIDASGAIVLSPQYESISDVINFNRVFVKNGDEFLLIDLTGNVIVGKVQQVNGETDSAYSDDMKSDQNGFIRIKINNCWQLIDFNGNRII